MFFINKKQIDGMICDDETINAFKEDYKMF
jgi:hypothetical protein